MEKTEIILEHTESPIIPQYTQPKTKAKTLLAYKKDILKLAGILFFGICWSRGEIFHILRPMSAAYIGLFFGEGAWFWAALLGAAAGGTKILPLKAGAVLAAACLTELTLGRFVSRQEYIKKSLLAAFSMALGGVFYAISQGGLYFYIAVALVESVLAFGISLLAHNGVALLWSGDIRLSKDNAIGLIIILGGGLMGLSAAADGHLGIAANSVLLPFFTAGAIAMGAWRQGITGGTAAAVILGFILYICGGMELLSFAILAVSGLMAGCVRNLGRIPVILALVLTPVLFMFYNAADMLQPLWSGAWALGAVIFVFMPDKWVRAFADSPALFAEESGKAEFIRKREAEEERLLGFASAFEALNKVFQPDDKEKTAEISLLADDIAKEACKGCGMAHYCWSEDVYHTYSMTFAALSHCEKKGHIAYSEMPEFFRGMCARGEIFTDALNHAYEGYYRDRLWQGRLRECRELMGRQLMEVSGLLTELSSSLKTEHIIMESMAERLREAAADEGIRLKDVRVTEDKTDGIRQAVITLRGCGCIGDCRNKLLPVVKAVMGPMELKNKEKCQCRRDGTCVLSFRQAPKYSLATAGACICGASEGGAAEGIMGDSFCFLETEKGVGIMALSDGMGQGKKAAAESRTAIELLEQFTEAGFSRELAVRMINSALLLRRPEESYATLDICAIDLFSGAAEFIKLGAVAAYIRRGERIITLTAHTLPLGILKETSVAANRMPLKDGDMIIMVSDGITDALGGEDETACRLKGRSELFNMANPQDCADFILREAKKAAGGEHDDMTVIAGRFWRRV